MIERIIAQFFFRLVEVGNRFFHFQLILDSGFFLFERRFFPFCGQTCHTFFIRIFHFCFADGLFVCKVFQIQCDIFQFDRLGKQVVFFVCIIKFLQIRIGCFYLSDKFVGVKSMRTDGTVDLGQFDQLLRLGIADQDTVLNKVYQILQCELVTDFLDELVFRHMALRKVLAQKGMAEFPACIVKIRIVYNNLFDLFLGNGNTHQFCTLFQIGALQQGLEYGIA